MSHQQATSQSSTPRALVIGGGPAGLMAAETLLENDISTELVESAPSLARKFLIAGKGGLNLTHSEAYDLFVSRYRERQSPVGAWLTRFGPDQLRLWATELGIDTVVGSSGRVFPADFKAGPLLRRWVRRLRSKGLVIRTRTRFAGWNADGSVRLIGADGEQSRSPLATVLAMGGSSWSKLGASDAWVEILRDAGVEVADLRPSNCGFDCTWSDVFKQRYAGVAVKQVVAKFASEPPVRGEFMLTEHGVEGSLIYALSAPLREQIQQSGSAEVRLDLAPNRELNWLRERLKKDRGSRSWSEFLRRQLHI